MSIVADLLQALNIPELRLFITAIPDDDDVRFVNDLSTMLGDAYGGIADTDVRSRTGDAVAKLIQEIGPSFGAGANPVTAAILADQPGATYGDMVKLAVQAKGSAQVRPAVVATEGAAEILAELTAAGIEWGQPDTTIPGGALTQLRGDSPVAETLSDAPVPVGDAETAPLAAAVAVPQTWKDDVKQIVDKIQQAVGGSGMQSNLTRGAEVHLIIQAQYALWAAQQAPTHLVVLDNKVPDPHAALPWPQDLPSVKAWFKNAHWLHQIQIGSPNYTRYEPIIDALGTGRGQNSSQWPRPDILDLETHRLWEIKSIDSWTDGIGDIMYYLGLLNLQVFSQAVIDSVLGSMVDGTPTVAVPQGFWLPGPPWMPWPFIFGLSDGNGAIAFPAGPGLILYQVIDKDLYTALAAVVTAGVLFLAMMTFYLQLLKHGLTAAAARAAALAALAAALIAVVASAVAEVLLALAAIALAVL